MPSHDSGEVFVPASSAPVARRDNPLTRSVAGMIGAAFLLLMLVLCVGTLPWTLGPVESQGVTMPRFSAGEIAHARQPPSWWPAAGPAPVIPAPADATSAAPASAQTPSQTPSYFLGSDVLGRSLLVRVLAGGGVSLAIGITAALLSVLIGTLYGAISGFAGGRVDAFMMRVVDILYGLPYVLLVVLLAVATDAVLSEYVSRERARAAWVQQEAVALAREANLPADAEGSARFLALNPARAEALRDQALKVLPPRQISQSGRLVLDLIVLLIAIGGVSWLTMARVIRGQVLSLKAQPFVEAARAIGASRRRILFVHLLPNLVGPITVYATLTVPQAILQESFLSFLGIGVKPPLPSWGNLAAEGLPELNPFQSNWWLLLFPCLMLGMTLLALNFVGEGLREALDPRRGKR